MERGHRPHRIARCGGGRRRIPDGGHRGHARLGGRPLARADKRVEGIDGTQRQALFLPLRRALTGRDHGPDMAALLPLIDRAEAVARLRAAAA